MLISSLKISRQVLRWSNGAVKPPLNFSDCVHVKAKMDTQYPQVTGSFKARGATHKVQTNPLQTSAQCESNYLVVSHACCMKSSMQEHGSCHAPGLVAGA